MVLPTLSVKVYLSTFVFLPSVQVGMDAQGHPMEPVIIPVYPWYNGIQKVSKIPY